MSSIVYKNFQNSLVGLGTLEILTGSDLSKSSTVVCFNQGIYRSMTILVPIEAGLWASIFVLKILGRLIIENLWSYSHYKMGRFSGYLEVLHGGRPPN